MTIWNPRLVLCGFVVVTIFVLGGSFARADFAAAKQAEARNDLAGMFAACKADAGAGEPKCQNIVGVLNKLGLGGVEKNPEHAASLFEKSCAGGYWKGCANLGGLYSAGIGVAKDPDTSVKYIDKAYGLVKNIYLDVHPAMLIRAANAYRELESVDRLRALEGYVKYTGLALGLKSSVYGKFGADKGSFLSEHQGRYENTKWFVTVAKLRRGGTVALGVKAAPSTPVQSQKPTPVGNARFQDCPTCPVMISIAPGSFKMGDSAGRTVESGTHMVAIKTPLAVGRYEVSFADWDQCISDKGCSHRPDDKGWGRGKQPVMNVSLNDVISYLRWLSNKAGKTYRLPSEAEWEYLARGGVPDRWPWGGQPSAKQANCKDCGGQWGGRQSAPVGSFAANKFGIYDAIGNVWEMTRDCKHDSYAGAPTDGQPWLTGDCAYVMVRGGSWDTPKENTYVAIRNWMTTEARHELVGFRVIRELAIDEVPGQQIVQTQPPQQSVTPSSSASVDARFAAELVDCAALGNIQAEESGNTDAQISKESDRDKLVDAARYFLGKDAADKVYKERVRTTRAKFDATGGQSSKLRMLGDTCQALLDDPARRYAFWQKAAKN